MWIYLVLFGEAFSKAQAAQIEMLDQSDES